MSSVCEADVDHQLPVPESMATRQDLSGDRNRQGPSWCFAQLDYFLFIDNLLEVEVEPAAIVRPECVRELKDDALPDRSTFRGSLFQQSRPVLHQCQRLFRGFP